MSSFSTQGLIALLTRPAQRILQDVQVLGLKAGASEEPTAGTGDEGGGVEEARSSPLDVKAPSGVIRGVRAVAPAAASSVRAGAPAEQDASLSRTASESVRAVEGKATQGTPGHEHGAEQPSLTAVRSSPVPRLVLRRDGAGTSVPRAPARAIPPTATPMAAPSEVPEGVTPKRAVEELARAPESPREGAEGLARGSEERGIPVRPVSRPQAGPVPVAPVAPSEASAEDGAQALVPPTAVPHAVSAPVSSEPPLAPASERPGSQGLPRLVLRRAPAAPRDSWPRPAVASVPESRVLTPEPSQPPQIVPPGASEVRNSRTDSRSLAAVAGAPEVPAPGLLPSQPSRVPPPASSEMRSALGSSASVQPNWESAASRRERSEGIPLMPRGPRWSSREPAEPEGLERVGQSAPVPEQARLAPGGLASVRSSTFVSEPPPPVSTPVIGSPPVAPALPSFTPPPEGLLRDGVPLASPVAEALPLDREQLEELLVDILQAAARGEGVEV